MIDDERWLSSPPPMTSVEDQLRYLRNALSVLEMTQVIEDDGELARTMTIIDLKRGSRR